MKRASPRSASRKGVSGELAKLRARNEELEQVLRAASVGEVDALVAAGPSGPALFTLKGAEHSYRFMVEAMTEGAATLGPQSEVLYCNPKFAEMISKPSESIVGSAFRAHFSAGCVSLLDELAMRARQAPASLPLELQHADGTAVPVNVALRTVGEDSDRNTIAIVSDLTTLRRAEAYLIRNEKKYRKTFEHAPVAMARLSRDECILEANLAYLKMFGYTRDEVVGMPAMNFIEPEFRQAAQAEIQSLWSGTLERVSLVQPLTHRDGSRIWAQFSATIVSDDEKEFHLLVHLQDITGRKLAEEQLFHSQKMEAVGNLAAGIAHDVNNMLLPIIVMTELIRDELPTDSPLQENIEVILEASTNARNLIKQMLTFGREEPEVFKDLPISAFLEMALKLVRDLLPSTITIPSDIAPDLGLVHGDSAQLQSLILNVCTNAQHAIGGKVGRITITLTKVTPDDRLHTRLLKLNIRTPYAKLSVTDTGCGMDEATRKKIFNPFFTTKKVGEGTGLGLSMVHNIVERHQGAIDVISEVGVGTTFDIYLPLREPGQQQPHA